MRAGWDATLVDAIPNGDLYTDVETQTCMRQFHDFLRGLQIGYEITYSDSANRWYVGTSSAAREECFTSKSRGWVASAAEDCLRYLADGRSTEILNQHEYVIVEPYKKAV